MYDQAFNLGIVLMETAVILVDSGVRSFCMGPGTTLHNDAVIALLKACCERVVDVGLSCKMKAVSVAAMPQSFDLAE